MHSIFLMNPFRSLHAEKGAQYMIDKIGAKGIKASVL